MFFFNKANTEKTIDKIKGSIVFLSISFHRLVVCSLLNCTNSLTWDSINETLVCLSVCRRLFIFYWLNLIVILFIFISFLFLILEEKEYKFFSIRLFKIINLIFSFFLNLSLLAIFIYPMKKKTASTRGRRSHEWK